MKKTIHFLLICAVAAAMLLRTAPVFAEPEDEAVSTEALEAVTEVSEDLQEEQEEAEADPETEPARREAVSDSNEAVSAEDPQESEPEDETCKHVYVEEVTPPTCEEQGFTLHTCSLCGESYVDDVKPALGHDWGSWHVVKGPTYEAFGMEQRECANDPSHVEGREIPVLKGTPILVGSARSAENERSDTYGVPGDQTGHELETQDWYLHRSGWVVIRATDLRDREMIARDMEAACGNPSIGYCQQDTENETLFYASADVGYDCSLVNKAVNTDCSRLVRVCLWYAGIEVPKFYTGDQVKTLEATGRFQILTDPIYTESPAYLLRGDILVTKKTGHTVVVLGNGPLAEIEEYPAAAPVVTRQPQDVTIKEGMTATFSVTAAGRDLTYRWFWRDGTGGSWTMVPASECSAASYSFRTSAEYKDRQYRCTIVDGAGRQVISEPARLDLKLLLGIVTQPADAEAVGRGSSAAVSVKAKGEDLSYSWYKCGPGEAEFTLTEATSASYEEAMTELNNGSQVYCVVTDGDGNSIRSNIAAMTYVDAVPQIRTQPSSEVVKVSTTARFSVKADGVETYQWYYRTSSKGSWRKVTAASGKTASYSLTATSSKHGYQYRCKLTNGTGSVYTSIVKLTVVTAKPSIRTQPVSKTARAGRTVTFKVVARGRALSYQWYYRTSSKGAWHVVTVASGTKASCSFTAARSMKGYQYRCIVKNLKGTATSRTVKLTVK